MRDKFCGIGQFNHTSWESYHMKLELDLIKEYIRPEDNIWSMWLSKFLDPENPDQPNDGREMKVKIEGLNKRCSQINEISIINASTGVSIWNAISIKRIKEEGGGPDDTKLILEIPGTRGFVSIDTFSDEQWKHLVVHEESFQPDVAAQVKKRKRHKKSKKSKRKKLSKKHSKKHSKIPHNQSRKSKKHKKSKKHIKSKKHKKSKK